jgi:hypothetical protein
MAEIKPGSLTSGSKVKNGRKLTSGKSGNFKPVLTLLNTGRRDPNIEKQNTVEHFF